MARLALYLLSKTGKAEASDASVCQGVPGPQPFPMPPPDARDIWRHFPSMNFT